MNKTTFLVTLTTLLCFGVPALGQTTQASASVPVVVITTADSEIKFGVKASVAIEGKFDKWEATLKFASTDPSTGVLDIKIDAASVNTGSGMKDDKLRSRDFFNVKEDPVYYVPFYRDRADWSGYVRCSRNFHDTRSLEI